MLETGDDLGRAPARRVGEGRLHRTARCPVPQGPYRIAPAPSGHPIAFPARAGAAADQSSAVTGGVLSAAGELAVASGVGGGGFAARLMPRCFPAATTVRRPSR